MTVREVTFTGSDKSSRMHGLLYLPDQPRAIVQIVHDCVEHIGLYTDLMQALFRSGFAVCAHDQLGHGRSVEDEESLGCWGAEARRFLIVDLSKMTRIARKEAGELPVFLLGQGLGAAVSRLYAASYEGLAGLILSGERKASSLQKTWELLERMMRGEERRVAGLTKKDPEDLVSGITGDVQMQKRLLDDRLIRFIPTLAARREIARIWRMADRKETLESLCETPVLLLAGGDDPNGKNGAVTERLFHRLGAHCSELTYKLYPQGRAQLYLDLQREEVYMEIIQWMDSCLKAKQKEIGA